jgi:hypothetical protein
MGRCVLLKVQTPRTVAEVGTGRGEALAATITAIISGIVELTASYKNLHGYREI